MAAKASTRKKINILMTWFGSEKSWGEGRTYQQVAEHLAVLPEVNRVIMTFPPKNTGREFNWPLKIKHISNKLSLVSEYTNVIPTTGLAYQLRTKINTLVNAYSLPFYLRLLGFRKDNSLLWVFPPHPYIDALRKRIPHCLLVGHIVDNFLYTSDPWLKEYAEQQYPMIKDLSDVIIVGSKFNENTFSGSRATTLLFENAVDKSFISPPSKTPRAINSTIKLGYIGTLSDRTDFDLLEYLAKNRPDWHFIIAGKSELPLEELSFLKLPNVEYKGLLPYQSLPALMYSFDVCLIPHRNTTYCKSMSPLKLFQYLASGRPIVSTDIEGLDIVKHHLQIASSYSHFMSLVQQTLEQDTIEMSASRIECAKQQTWDLKTREMFNEVITKVP